MLSVRRKELADLCRDRPEIGWLVYRAIAGIVAARLRQAYTQILGVTAQY